MPPLKIDIALDAINRRLKTFAKNPENPRQIEQTFLERIYKSLNYNMQEITFRRVMREVLNEFEAGHFDALSTNPIKIPDEIIDKIKSQLTNNLVIKKQLGMIVSSNDLKPAQKRHCLELLTRIYLYDGLAENEIREFDIPFLQRLQKASLIIKVMQEGLVWKINKTLHWFNREIINAYGLSLEDYLIKLYQDHIPEKSQALKLHNEDEEDLKSIAALIQTDLVRHFIIEAKSLHHKVVDSKGKYLAQDNFNAIVKDCAESLAKLTKAYMAYERIKNSSRTDLQVLFFWRDFWWSPESIQQFIRASESDIDVRRKTPLILALYREAFSQITSFFTSEIKNAKIFRIPIFGLKNSEIKLLHESRHLWTENNYTDLADQLVKHIERKLRIFLYDIFTLLYGDQEKRIQWLDKNSRSYILSNTEKDLSANLSVSNNEFQQLNRGQYKIIMTGINNCQEGQRNWNCIFSRIFVKWDERDLNSYLNMLAEINIRISHLKDNSITVTDQDFVYDFMQKSTRFMIDINKSYQRLLFSNCVKQKPNIYLSFNSFKDQDSLTPIESTDDDIKRIIEAFKDRSHLKVPLDDQEYVEGLFGLSYRKAYALLALLYQGIVVDNKMVKLHIQATKGPEIRMRLISTTGMTSA